MKTKINLLITIFILSIGCTTDDNNGPNYVNDLSSIQGDWYRVGGNNPDNNGMKVNVDDDQGVLEEPALSNFQIDDIKWADIVQSANDVNVFSYQELGSNYNYFDATMELGVDDTLRISVADTGIGNIQKWVRTVIDPAQPEPHDCFPYGAMSFNDNRLDDWLEFNEFDNYPSLLEVPSDELGGGYFSFSINTMLVPSIRITSSAGSSGSIFTGSSAGTTNENTNQVAFLAHPGIAYDVRVNPFTGTADFPLPYSLSWTFNARMDCYEPNNTLSQAKFIPKNETLEAYGLSGYVTNSVASGDENTYDWYKVTTTSEGKLRFNLESCPSDLNVSCRLMYTDGSQMTGQLISTGSNTYYYESNASLPAGTYVIELQMGGAAVVDLNVESIPLFWNETYQFSVETIQ